MDNNIIDAQCEKCGLSEKIASPFIMVIFGASGDLTQRKLIPSLFSLFERDLLPENFCIIGCARTPMDDNSFRELAGKAIKERYKETLPPKKILNIFTQNMFYISGQYDGFETYKKLSAKISEIEKGSFAGAGRVFYLAVPGNIYGKIVKLLKESNLVNEDYDGIPCRRVIIEKPFGYDLASSRILEKQLKNSLRERQIYRIDHYLGKETVQNILMLRFANMIFEPLWNNRYIDHVQITVAESIGVERRAGYFDQSGLLRDMFQNHMIEMLSLVAMEPPASFDADRVRDEKVKLLHSIHPFSVENIPKDIIRGQYVQGTVDGENIRGYKQEDGVTPDSLTETYVAAKLKINNWRWNGVPFYLRAGKRLNRRVSEIAVTFKNIPYSIFRPLQAEDLKQNVLVLNVQPEEGFAMNIQAKKPGPKLCMGDLTMDFFYRDIYKGEPPEAYERLILDCMLGDSTLFIRNDTIELSWSLWTPVLDVWKSFGDSEKAGKIFNYTPCSWGPEEAGILLSRDGRKWRVP